ncbi:pilus assembly protein [Tropicimonas sp. IMCC6043]|uniref:pilus assembly protein n=1 Tax=Tropicimonas sp. IMCC6043 TaxID=2510645 RepID=UPI00101DB4E7|nr:pilus assembly protein [Tropicimonas sp. IMCC6043]RYH10706.1 pilus assembly protein [Tropicimonas sp. IMCC6043]
MQLLKRISTFREECSGAVTVDWIVLTAVIVGTGIAVVSTVSTGVGDLSGDISGQLSVSQIRTAFR